MGEAEAKDALIRQTEDVASATECTGLVPALENGDSESARRALYAVHRARRPGRMYRKR